MNADERAARPGRVALIALGNRLRGDDAVGPIVGERVLERLREIGEHDARRAIDFHCGPMDALAIVSAWSGATGAIVIDAAASGHPAGTLHRIDLAQHTGGRFDLLPRSLARASSHGLGLFEALALARALGRVPPRLVCFAIEARDFGEATGLSRELRAALEAAVARIADEIVATWHHRDPSPSPHARGG